MKQRNLKRAVSVLLALVMLIGFVPVLELPAAAKEVTGNVKASRFPAGDGLVLTGNTVLNMDMEMAPTETFMEGEPYCIAIRLNADAGAAFAAEPDFFINGKEVNTYGWVG